MAQWDVLVTTHDDTGKRVSEALGSFGPEGLADAVVEACHRAGQVGGGIQVVRRLERAGRPAEPTRVA